MGSHGIPTLLNSEEKEEAKDESEMKVVLLPPGILSVQIIDEAIKEFTHAKVLMANFYMHYLNPSWFNRLALPFVEKFHLLFTPFLASYNFSLDSLSPEKRDIIEREAKEWGIPLRENECLESIREKMRIFPQKLAHETLSLFGRIAKDSLPGLVTLEYLTTPFWTKNKKALSPSIENNKIAKPAFNR